ESNPAAYRIVVTNEGNSAPRITACLPQSIPAGDIIQVSVRITDPDGDGIGLTSATANEATVDELQDGVVIGDCFAEPSAAVGSTVTRVYSLEAPLAGSSLDLTLAATDAREATRYLTVTIAP